MSPHSCRVEWHFASLRFSETGLWTTCSQMWWRLNAGGPWLDHLPYWDGCCSIWMRFPCVQPDPGTSDGCCRYILSPLHNHIIIHNQCYCGCIVTLYNFSLSCIVWQGLDTGLPQSHVILRSQNAYLSSLVKHILLPRGSQNKFNVEGENNDSKQRRNCSGMVCLSQADKEIELTKSNGTYRTTISVILPDFAGKVTVSVYTAFTRRPSPCATYTQVLRAYVATKMYASFVMCLPAPESASKLSVAIFWRLYAASKVWQAVSCSTVTSSPSLQLGASTLACRPFPSCFGALTGQGAMQLRVKCPDLWHLLHFALASYLVGDCHCLRSPPRSQPLRPPQPSRLSMPYAP